MFTQNTVKVIAKKVAYEYTTEELHLMLGNFEKEYNENSTGEVIRNEILGHVREGTVVRALRLRAITKHEVNGRDVYFINLPEYRDYEEKHQAMCELISRRGFAKNKNLERLTN